jgi:threonyl-tRNA synthetase
MADVQFKQEDKPVIEIILPDGSKRHYNKPVTGLDIAKEISSSLAKIAVAVRVNGEQWDLIRPIEQSSQFEIITRTSDEGLDIIRHDTAHILAEAVKELYPETQITIGPSIENGFYYDFYREKSFTPDDFEVIEARMREIVDRDEEVVREVWDREEAIAHFENEGEFFKAEIIRDLPKSDTITVYRQGSFADLCRGPHLPSTKRLGKAFKLMKLAGAYWRGDSNNPMLQRIYGTAWADDKQLAAYLTQLEEAEKRDHRRLGREMGFFHQQEEAAGSVFWHPRGWQFYRTLEEYIRRRLANDGYVEVKTPILVDRSLWERSGHWEKFGENMFTVENEDGHTHAIKPMNCPCHVEIFKQGMKSYRDLPLRMSEFGACHRNEPSGALNGLLRVRAFTQDDAHIFCTEDQILEETKRFCELLLSVYKDFGFEEVRVMFSTRPEVRAGSDDVWDRAEQNLANATKAMGLETIINPGEGAFYGPKLEFQLKDAIGRSWQCGTLQLDFVLPERLDATYIGTDGNKHRPVMLHRAILGSMERFSAVLIENYAGNFPLWLAPVQVVVASIAGDFNDYATEICDKLRKAGLRAETDLRNEKISYKVRELSLQKIPVIMAVGQRERDEHTVAIRRLGSTDQEVLAFEAALAKLIEEARMPSV